MIKTLKLTKFRKVIDDTMTFSEGLNVLRAPNEGSKTTRLEAVAYALYGTKALRDSLAQCVTWGHKESELKVELVIEAEGKDFTFKRSKAGAEVIVGGKVFVTGQSEVTAFASQLLGADAKTASSLMLADQSGLRGALDEGPTAVSGLMAKLADFALVDRIVEGMQSSLLLGADAPIREKLRAAEAEFEEAVKAMPVPHVLADFELDFKGAEQKLYSLRKQREDNEAPAYNLAADKLSAAEAAKEKRDAAVAAVDRAQERLGKAVTALDDANARVVDVDTGRIEELRKAVFDFAEALKKADAWAAFNAMPAFPDAFWEGDSDSFHAFLSNSRSLQATASDKVAEIRGQIVRAQAGKIVGGLCKVCGTDVSQRPDILEKNAAVDAEVAGYEQALAEWQGKLKAINDDVAAADAVARAARSYAAALPAIARAYVEEVNLTFPTRYKWVGGNARVDVKGFENIKAELAGLERQAEAVSRAKGEVAALTRALEQAKLDYADAAARLQNTPDVDLGPVKEVFNAASVALNQVDDLIYAAEETWAKAKAEYDAMAALMQQCLTRSNAAKERVGEYTRDIEQLGFNNTLLKKMRAIKPSVTDHLWNSVLAAVSQFFTQLRGEASVVTKDGDGFKVNGASVKSLSGSTLDVLALAVRVALTKTFIPNTSLLVLDEPAYGCDASRTAAMLGFLSSVGFKQVVLASHDELSEAVSDRVISLERL